jgi:general L-amino acid transport system permease protein
MGAPAAEDAAVRQTPRPPPWRDVRVLRIAFQVVFAVAVVALARFLYTNLITNLSATGLPTGFGFLNNPTGFDIRGVDFRISQPIRDALLIGWFNTIRVAAVGIALATVLGILVGIARLSTNWLVRKAAAIYVEALRNTPVLLTIAFMYFAVVLGALPGIADATNLLGLMVLSTRGIWIVWGDVVGPASALVAFMGVGLALAIAIGIWRTRRFNETGVPHHRILFGFIALVVVTAVGYVILGAPVEASLPTRDGRLVEGGLELQPTYGALLAGLVLYTASHIAEIVRGSILAVPKGQGEAAQALALSGFQRMRYVILPQAARIAVPPLSSQYLNLTKNSSLAIFVGYVELTRVTFTVIGNANPAPQSVAVLALGYLVLSLAISLVANIVNRALALPTR